MRSECRRAIILLGLILVAGPGAAQQPSQAQISAIRSACRGDYQSVCANVPTGGQAALQCLQQHADQVSAGCRGALAPLGAAQGQPAAQAAPGAAARVAPPPPMSPREEIRLLRSVCGSDFRTYCAGVRPGGGRGLACLQAHGPDLAPQCQSALMAARQRQ
jgi:hypothetical protein